MNQSQVLFPDTPLAEYVEESSGMNDWGIEDDRQADDKQDSECIQTQHLSSTQKLRSMRFKALIKTSFQSGLSASETAQFLERFRFVLTSLCRGGGADAVDSSEKEWSELQLSQNRNLYGDNGPWSVLAMQRKFWTVSGGGCVVLIVSVITIGLKNNRFGSERVRGLAIIIVCICVLLFSYAHARRRILRMLRAKATSYLSHYSDAAAAWELASRKIIMLIKGTEVLSQGFRPDLAGASLGTSNSTVGRNLDLRQAKHLRSALAASLFQTISNILNSIHSCRVYSAPLDLQMYLDIYEIDLMLLDDMGLVSPMADVNCANVLDVLITQPDECLYFGKAANYTPLHDLKVGLATVAVLKKIFACCLMSIPSTGKFTATELRSWKTVVEWLKQGADSFSCATDTLNKERFVHSSLSHKSATDKQESEADSHGIQVLHSLNDLSSHIHFLEARIQLLRESMSAKDYDSIGEELVRLTETYQKAANIFVESSENAQEETECADEPVTSTPNKRWSVATFESLESSASTLAPEEVFPLKMSSPSPRMSVLEGIVEADRPKTVLNRQERMKQMYEQRRQYHEHKAQQAQKQMFAAELGDVLSQREARMNQ